MTERAQPDGRRAAAHSALMVTLIAARPLVWDEDPLNLPVTVYGVLVLLGCGAAVLETALGSRTWRWGRLSALVAGLILWLGLAAWRSPLPIVGWGLWSGIALNGALGLYLLQVLPARRGMALAALGAGLLGEVLISALQWPWVLPAMARAQQAGQLRIVPQALQGSLAERIANGGLFGTFTQANALAGYLLVAVPPLAVAGYQARGLARALALATVALAALVFIGTSSKGADIAAAAALLGTWWWRRWPWRWPVVALAALGVGVALLSPGIHRALHDSASVRVGYWDGACALVRERPVLGYGLGSFGEQFPRVTPEWASYSNQVHCEVLAAAAETGLPGALALLALLVALLLPRMRATTTTTNATTAPLLTPSPTTLAGAAPILPRWAPWAVGGGILYLELLGLLNANTGWWPGSNQLVAGLPLIEMGWWLAIAVLIGLAAYRMRALAPLEAACRIAVAAVVLHCLVDFDWHAGGITGTVIVVWLLAQPAASDGEPDRDLAMRPRGWRLQALLLAAGVLGSLALVGAVQPSLGRLRDAHQIVDDAQLLTQPGLDRGQALAALAHCSELAGEAMPDDATFRQPQDMKLQLNRCLLAGLQLAHPDPELQTRILVLLPPGAERLPVSMRLRQVRPSSALVAREVALDQVSVAAAQEAVGDAPGVRSAWQAALDAMRAAVDLAPHDLAVRSDLADLLGQAARHLPDAAERFHGEAQMQVQYIAQHHDLVDPSNRP